MPAPREVELTIGSRTAGVSEERALAGAVEALDREVQEQLAGIPAAARVLRRTAQSRGAAYERLAAALAAAAADPRTDRDALARAREPWREAEQLRWALAWSARGVLAREARKLAHNPTLPVADLEQEGWFGLLAAARRFDPARGVRFGTYARWWARAAMTHAVDLARPVRLSASAAEQLRNLKKEICALEVRRGSEGVLADAARALGLAPATAKVLLEGGGTVSIERPEPDAPAREPVDDALLPDARAERQEALDRVAQALEHEPARTRTILARRYGLTGGAPESLDRIANRLGLSRECVRRLERAALARLATACAPAAPAQR